MHTGLLDSFAAFWGKVAQEFSTSSSVIGYEIINEPWAGWFYTVYMAMVYALFSFDVLQVTSTMIHC